MMKKFAILATIIFSLVLLAACSSPTAAGTAVSSTPLAASAANTDLPRTTQLILGTFRLAGSDFPVDSNQAAQLLPLWKAVKTLGEDQTTAAEEMESLYTQIEETMTLDQLDAIAAMQLSRDDYQALAADLGLDLASLPGAFGGTEVSPEMRATAQAARESGQVLPGFGEEGSVPGFGGGPGGGAGGGFRGQGAADGTDPQAGSGLRARGNTMLIDALIAYLQELQ